MEAALSYDWRPVRAAFLAGDYSLCGELLEGAPEPQASIWRSRIDLREVRYAEAIARLHALKCTDAISAAERDAWLAAAYSNSSDSATAKRLIERALETLKPQHEAYYRAIYIRGLSRFLAGDLDGTLEDMNELLGSADPSDRGSAYAMRSWVALKRGDMQAQLDSMLDALDEYVGNEGTDQYGFANTVQTLAVFCRERPIDDAIVQRVRDAAERLRFCDATAFTYFQTIRLLGWIDALRGDEHSAMRRWSAAQRCAPSPFWRVFCIVDRAYLARVMGRAKVAAELLESADRVAHTLRWQQTHEEERLILLTIAQLFSQSEPARTERYLAMYRSLTTSMHVRLKWQGDPRFRALELYPHAVALLHMGEREAAIPMLEEACNLFMSLDYRWRAALAARDLYHATHEVRWLECAREQAAPWPKSWIARDVREPG